MTELSLQDAATYIGVPAGVLHQWAWSKTIPTANHRLWKPTFNKAALDQFMAEKRVTLSRSLS